MAHLNKEDAAKLLARRHPEWEEHQRRWRWLQDSLEGGNRYRMADYTIPTTVTSQEKLPWYNYGFDATTSQPYVVTYGQIVDRNLIPHLSETDEANRDIYAMRLARTPVPCCVSFALRRHLARIFSHEVQREGPAAIVEWWKNVDGAGTPIDKWVRKVIGPLFLVLGQLDVVIDRPEPPESTAIRSRADERKYGLNTVVASYIVPENMIWWRVDRRTRQYLECLVFERSETEAYYRHWTATESNAYDGEGQWIPPLSYEHNLGRVPIERVFDDKKPRQTSVGQSRYEVIADLQKAIYNALSELILSDINQAHPLLSGPQDVVQSDTSVQVGPSNVLPKIRTPDGDYVGWEFVSPPKEPAAEIRTHIQDLWDEVYRQAALLKPAGTTDGKTVGQSGISKSFDHQEANDYLSEVAETLAEAEERIAELALLVLSNGDPKPADVEAITVTYPREFDLQSGEDLSSALNDIQGHIAAAGDLPETTKEYLKRRVTRGLPGLPDDRQDQLREEVEQQVDAKSNEAAQRREGQPLPGFSGEPVDPGNMNPGGDPDNNPVPQGMDMVGAISDFITSPAPS
jgi:hypothetical protein